MNDHLLGCKIYRISAKDQNANMDIFKAYSRLFENWCRTQNFHLCSNYDEITLSEIRVDNGPFNNLICVKI